MLGKRKNKQPDQRTELENDHIGSWSYLTRETFTDLLDERDRVKKIVEEFEESGNAWRPQAQDTAAYYNAVKDAINARCPIR